MTAQSRDNGLGCVAGLGEEAPAGELGALADRAQNLRFLLGAKSLHGAQAAFADRPLELVEILDIQLPVKKRRGLGTDALQVEEVENRRGKLSQELLVICDHAGLDQLADLRGEVLADAWYGEALSGRQIRETLSGVGG